MAKSTAAVCVLLVLALALVVGRSEAVTCGEVNSSLAQCLKYLTGDVAAPSEACCAGVGHIRDICKSSDDKRVACSCLKQAAAGIHNIKAAAASELPNKCGLTLPIPISPDTDCTQIP
ncbi:hypothetical protein H6P81_010865 [Aristolochia fimbriata]|uniref:Non-specific lipid-transfer protein n=1 Tax=Aristolochia fimbriata TaxID=158543 RepID=A0AAV7EPZ8_ARIFI|nr:hypothetical protein H6P81_010865 [Aristolochia fimbriata]